MKVKFYQPIHPILKEYIEGYYFISKESKQFIKYLTFPDNYFILSSCQNAEFFRSDNFLEISQSKTENITIDFVTRCTKPTEIHYKELINEITIYFKPLGIYHFFVSKNCTDLNSEIFKANFEDLMKIILDESNRQIQIEKLENYWLSKFKKKDFQLVEKILCDFESELKIEEIAIKNNITRQYLNKILSRYLGKPASEFRKIQRFRKSIIDNKNVKNLTELSYENLFYDQSHFIKDFKELTKIKPSKFFENVNTEQNNIWLFI